MARKKRKEIEKVAKGLPVEPCCKPQPRWWGQKYASRSLEFCLLPKTSHDLTLTADDYDLDEQIRSSGVLVVEIGVDADLRSNSLQTDLQDTEASNKLISLTSKELCAT